MTFNGYENYIVPVGFALFLLWRFIKAMKVKSRLPELLEKGAVIVDVRSPREFQQGAAPGSINIPLDEISARARELDPSKTLILCCASGARSGVAVGIFRKIGFANVVNAGSWRNAVR